MKSIFEMFRSPTSTEKIKALKIRINKLLDELDAEHEHLRQRIIGMIKDYEEGQILDGGLSLNDLLFEKMRLDAEIKKTREMRK